MLMLSRRIGDVLYLDLPNDQRVEIHLAGIQGNVARIGIKAPQTVAVTRAELENPRAKVAAPTRR